VAALRVETTGIPDAAHVLYREIARAESGSLDVGAVNRTWARRAFDFLRDEPALALRRLAQKARWAGHRFAPHDILGTAAYADSLPLPELPWGVLSRSPWSACWSPHAGPRGTH
jgi:hypothetical protein